MIQSLCIVETTKRRVNQRENNAKQQRSNSRLKRELENNNNKKMKKTLWLLNDKKNKNSNVLYLVVAGLAQHGARVKGGLVVELDQSATLAAIWLQNGPAVRVERHEEVQAALCRERH